MNGEEIVRTYSDMILNATPVVLEDNRNLSV
jgi:hypothetical protein